MDNMNYNEYKVKKIESGLFECPLCGSAWMWPIQAEFCKEHCINAINLEDDQRRTLR